MGEINFFESIEYLEPKCPKCETVLEYGVNTRYDEKKEAHVCLKCGCILK